MFLYRATPTDNAYETHYPQAQISGHTCELLANWGEITAVTNTDSSSLVSQT